MRKSELILSYGVGNVEIHHKSSDWYKHQHQDNPAYAKLILHIVWEHDREVILENSSILPVLVLKGRVQKKIIQQYEELKCSTKWVACEDYLRSIESIYMRQMLSRVAIERLEKKSERIEQLLKLHKNDWEAVFYQLLARAFGFNVNALPFELLAVGTPYSLLRKYLNHELKLFALLFGQAGFLSEEPKDDYQQKLKREYEFLKKLHHLQALDASIWKFLRMRPANFPTTRLAQFTSLFLKRKNLFTQLQQSTALMEMISLFQTEPNPYWKKHYLFARRIKNGMIGKIGDNSIHSIIINAVLPLLFCWMQSHGREEADRVLSILEEMKAEENNFTRAWKERGVEITNALDSQASIQLKKEYCDMKKCLNCTIGNAILKKQQ